MKNFYRKEFVMIYKLNRNQITFYKTFSSKVGSKLKENKCNNQLLSLFVADNGDYRAKLASFIKDAAFYDRTSAIYGGMKGFFDFGPIGCEIKNNIIKEWRQLFILEHDMLEVDCSIIGSAPMYNASGHMKHFNDSFVQDKRTGVVKRLDYILKEWIQKAKVNATKSEKEKLSQLNDQVDYMSVEEILEVIKQNKICDDSSVTQSKVNLMLTTDLFNLAEKGLLRPELAQGVFVNFPALKQRYGQRLPFGIGCVGTAFRNELTPHGGLFRCREFQLAEIEYFVNPVLSKSAEEEEDRLNDDVALVANQIEEEHQNILITLVTDQCQPQQSQHQQRLPVSEVWRQGLVQCIYTVKMMALAQQYFERIGLPGDCIRFREQGAAERAHYSSQSWDVECRTAMSGGWMEIAGLARRTDYDLGAHQAASQGDFRVNTSTTSTAAAAAKYEMRQYLSYCKKDLMNMFGSELADDIDKYLKEMTAAETEICMDELRRSKKIRVTLANNSIDLPDNVLSIVSGKSNKIPDSNDKVLPHVIELSFGIYRIFQALLEHSFHCRVNKPNRFVMRLPISIAPYKVAVFPLHVKSKEQQDIVSSVSRRLRSNLKIRVKTHSEGHGRSIGSRYTVVDSVGVPFVVTIDNDLSRCTIRERDSTLQYRISVDDLEEIINLLIHKEEDFHQTLRQFGDLVE